jgi:hypothetical protein
MFVFKMSLVALLIVFVIIMNRLRIFIQRTGDNSAIRAMKKLGMAGPVLGGMTILAAVSTFH